MFVIEEITSERAIGSCQLLNINWVCSCAELQIRIGNNELHGKGFGSEAVKLLIDFGFKDLYLHRIYLHVFITNTRAIRAYEKNGFIREGILRESAYIDNKFVDVVVMGLLRGSHD